VNPDLTEAVTKLTTKWSDVLSPADGMDTYRPIDYDPLLDMLAAAVTASTGQTESGRSDARERNPVNIQAFTLLERIDGQTRAWLKDNNVRAPKDLKAAVALLADRLGALWASNQIQEREYVRWTGMIRKWADDIWALFDPPTTKEIIGACPECGEEHSFGPEGEKSSAISAYYWRDVEPAAQCRRCDAEWKGQTQLIQLAYRIGASVDEDAIRELGDQ